MSRRTRENKGKALARKASARLREGTYYFNYINKSDAGVEYNNYRSRRGFRLPAPQRTLGLWDKFINVFKQPEVIAEELANG